MISHDGRVVPQYSQPGRSQDRVGMRRSDGYKPQSWRLPSSHHENGAIAGTVEVRGRSSHARRSKLRYRGPLQQVQSGMVTHNLVSFYFTNVPHDISHNSLRQVFEVCGMMEDVYLARKRKVKGFEVCGMMGDVYDGGGAFGFVDKLLKAVNNVWFGVVKVVAKVASFDRFGTKGVNQGSGVREKKLTREKKLKREKEEWSGGMFFREKKKGCRICSGCRC